MPPVSTPQAAPGPFLFEDVMDVLNDMLESHNYTFRHLTNRMIFDQDHFLSLKDDEILSYLEDYMKGNGYVDDEQDD